MWLCAPRCPGVSVRRRGEAFAALALTDHGDSGECFAHSTDRVGSPPVGAASPVSSLESQF